MNRIFVKQGLSLFGITLLLLAGLAGCGGDEAAPVARPPAPPPAPPAFTPEAVEVALGESGDNATLMTTEAGGFTLDGEAFESGAMVTAENGNVYTLELADGAWTAVFNAPEVEVMLGMSGSSATIVTAEDGTYWVGTDELMSGGMVMADNGYYTLTLEDGEWMAAFNPPMEDVMLGMDGGTITIVTAEDGTYWVGTDELMDGGMVMGENGMYYTLSMADGEWMSAFNAPDPEMVTLGDSGTTITIETAENGTYWVAGALFESGGTVTAENGNMYMVTQVAGEWSAAFQAQGMEIMGLDMMAMSTEDGMGYSVGDQMLDEDGMGDIMVDGDHFRVSMDEEEGTFMATQFDAKSEAYVADRDIDTDEAGMQDNFGGTLADDEDTAINEAGTALTIDGKNHKISDLFDDGQSVIEDDNIIAEQIEAIEKALGRIEALIAVIKAGDPDETVRGTDFAPQFTDRWQEIDTALGAIFGDLDEPVDLTDIDHLEQDTPPDKLSEIVPMVNKVLAALSSLEAFTEALGKDGLFVDSKGSIKDSEIEGIFNAVKAVWTVNLGRSDNTRYGVYSRTEYSMAMKKQVADDDEGSRYGAFAYSPHKASKMADLPTSGEAYYTGETIAQEQTEFTIYKGTIDLRVRFRSRRVSGLIRGLMDGDGKMYSRGGVDVDQIILPGASMTNTASWMVGSGTENATVVFVPTPGTGRPDTVDANFKGQLVGEGENAGAAAIGTWALMGTREDAGVDVEHDAGDLVGAYGAERGPDRPITPPDTADDGAKVKTVVHSVDTVTADDFIDDKGMIEVGGTDPADAEKMIQVATADLYANGEEMVQGTNFVEALKKALASQMEQLDAFIALDEADGDDANPTALTGRQTVWTAVEAELERVFDDMYDNDGDADTEADVVILSASTPTAGTTPDQLTSYPLNRAKDGPNDVTAKEEINDILAALGSLDAFETATEKDGIFYGETTTADDKDGLLDGQEAKDVFNRVPYTVTVQYGYTDYTRFGSWVRTGSDAAVDASSYDSDETTHTGHFAYSQEAQTPDDKFPRSGRATYEGRTIARDNAATSDGVTVPKFYHGDIELQVSWAGLTDDGADEAVTTSQVIAVIRNLMDADGGMYDDPAITTDGNPDKVSMITFSGAVTDTDDVLAWTSSAGRVRYEGFGLAETDVPGGASMSGSFVGESIEGPRGVIGEWNLNTNLSGVYGADLQP